MSLDVTISYNKDSLVQAYTKMRIPLLLVLFFIIQLIANITFHFALSQNLIEAAKPAPYEPLSLNGVNPIKNITILKTTSANVSNLEFTTSYNYQYITWIEHSGRTSIVFVSSSRDGGHTFDTPVNLSKTNGDASNQHFVVNLNNMYGVYVQHETNNQDVIKFTGTNDGGTHWHTFTLINTHRLVFELAIALQGDQVSVAWSDTNNIKTVNQYIVHG